MSWFGEAIRYNRLKTIRIVIKTLTVQRLSRSPLGHAIWLDVDCYTLRPTSSIRACPQGYVEHLLSTGV